MNSPARLFLLAAASTLAFSARAQDNTPIRSPFTAPPTAVAPADAAPDDSLQLIGVMSNNKESLVGITDKASKKTLWIPVGSTTEGIKIDSYDSAQDIAQITVGGAKKTLKLRKAPIASGQLIAPPPVPMPQNFSGTVTINNGTVSTGSGTLAYNSFPAPTPSAAPIVNPADAGKSPEIIAKETEARMMVTDLLEIGMVQRKEYERKQKEAEEAKKAAGK